MLRSTSARNRRSLLAGVAALVVLAALVAVPPLRGAASQFLDVFRVRKVVVVSFDPSKAQSLQDYMKQVFGDAKMPETKPVAVADAAEASRLAGYPVLIPAYLPPEATGETGALLPFSVTAERQAEADVNLAAARAMLQAAGLPTDGLPADQETMRVSALIPAMVMQHYGQGRAAVTVLQSASPEVNVPQGVDLRKLGEVGLRLLGLDQEKAQRLANSIDWATTLVIPIPANVASVREMTVRGNPGYLFNSARDAHDDYESVLFWQENGRLYAVTGILGDTEALHVAESLK